MRVTRLSLALLLAFAAALPACKPKEGGACKGTDSKCGGPSTGLFCVDGIYTKLACRGPKGCSREGTSLNCDQALTEPGDVCMGDGASCTPDHRAFMACVAHVATKKGDCTGPKGCYQTGQDIHCEHGDAHPGDACIEEGDAACTPDHKAFLKCTGGKYARARVCRGPKACRHDGNQVLCDGSIGEPGDPCTRGAACSADHKTFLECKAGNLTPTWPCHGKKGCYRDDADGSINCDGSVAAPGDACEGGAACSEDGHQFLECKDGKRVVTHDCPRGCTFEGTQVSCK